MERAVLQVFNISVMAGWMTLAVIILRPILAKLRVPVATRLVLWGMVAVRLLLPFSIESRYSLIPSAETIAEELIDEHDYNFSVQTGLDMIDDPVNQRLYSYYAESSNGEAWPDYLEERDDRAQAEEALQAGAYQAEGKETLDRQGAQPGVKTSQTGRRIVRVFTYVWVGGVAVMLLYGVFSFLFLCRKVSVRMPYHENGGREEAGETEAGAFILRAAKVYITEGTDTPFILGILCPVIYLPVTGKEERSLTHQEYEMILAHERAHIRNLDQFWKPLGFLLLSVYWFQPLLWVAYILFCRDIEFACDERVIRRMDAPHVKAYMETLLKCSSRGAQLAACPLAFGEVGVKQRIKAVWDYKKPTFWIVLAGIIACIAVAVTMLTTPEERGLHDVAAEAREMLVPWAEAVIDKDTETLATHCTEEVQRQMQESLPLSFPADGGDQSESADVDGYVWKKNDFHPWPKRSEHYETYRIITGIPEKKNYARINYYAYDPDTLMMYVWTEELTYQIGSSKRGRSAGDFQITEEKMTFQKQIADADSFRWAYVDGFSGTAFDYTANGLGEALLTRYREHNKAVYESLRTPATALCLLLHIDRQDDIRIEVTNLGDDAICYVELPYYDADGERNGSGGSYLQMTRYGSEGDYDDAIWIPARTTYTGEDMDKMEELSRQANRYNWPVIRTISVDLTGDGVADELTLRYDYSYETAGSAAVSSYEERIAEYGGVMAVTLTDGETGHDLFEQTYSAAHVGNGVLAIVQKQGRHYLLTGTCNAVSTGQWATYEASVLTWEKDEQIEIDRYGDSFPVDRDAIVREILREGTDYTFSNGKEVTAGLKEFIDRYRDGSELLFASDIMLSVLKESDASVKDVFLAERDRQYTLNSYYQYIWYRYYGNLEYTVGTFANLYGRSGFYIEERNPVEQSIRFYDGETGDSLADIWGCSVEDAHFVDLDGDGRNELIADTQAFGDGGRSLLIYREKDGRIMEGSGTDLLEDEIAAAYEIPGAGIGIWTVYAEYLPETNRIKVYYWNPEKGKHDSRIYDINLNRITFYEYVPRPW